MLLFFSYSYYYRHKLAERERMEMDHQISSADYNMAGYEGGGGRARWAMEGPSPK
jgi:hypothetical protein